MTTVHLFKAQRQTRRFRRNQKVWVGSIEQDHLRIWFRWRGKGTYVRGIIGRFDRKEVGPLIEVDVTEEFAMQMRGWDD